MLTAALPLKLLSNSSSQNYHSFQPILYRISSLLLIQVSYKAIVNNKLSLHMLNLNNLPGYFSFKINRVNIKY